jgi:molybdenum cofactor cytidylyltransferase
MEFIEEPAPASRVAAVVVATAASPGLAATLAEESWRGRSLLRGVVERLADIELVVVVVRDAAAAELVGDAGNVVVIVDPEWEEGSAAPLRAGLDYLTHSSAVEAAFVVSLDTPEIPPAALDELAAAHGRAETVVVVPKYRYVRGGPVLLGRDIWPRFLGAEGDLDLEHFLLAHPQWVTEVRVDWAPPRRVATTDDLAELAG